MRSLAFNLEKMNQPQDEEGIFREEWLRFYQPADLACCSGNSTGWRPTATTTCRSAG